MPLKLIGPKTNKSINHLYEPFLFLLLAFGYNFDFYNYNFVIKNLARFYCISLIAVVSWATFDCCNVHEVSQKWSLLEYTSSVLIILFFKSQMRFFLKKTKEVDSYLRVHRKVYYWERYKICFVTSTVWLGRIIYTYLYCSNIVCYDNFGNYVISLLSPFALDLNRVWRCVLFDLIRYRLKLLRIRMEENPEDSYYLYVKDNKSLREDKIKFCLFIYRRIADLVDMVSPEVHASLFMSVLCNLPKLVYNVYHVFTVIEGLEPYDSLSFVLIHLIQICVLLFTPFLIVEFFSVEVENIRRLLFHKYIDETNPEIKYQIKLFLKYTAMRSFKYKIWRMIPINLNLPLAMINICITYVIVVINFTHLYG